MFRVLSCLDGEHDLRLVGLAVAVCFVTSLVAVNLFQRARCDGKRSRWFWIATAGVVSGCGIWATHFIAMLAYEPGMPVGYDVFLTVLSLLSASVLMAASVAIAVFVPPRWGVPFSGAVIGLAVASMHYLGMAALEMPGRITWSADLVSASIVLGIGFGIAAMYAATRPNNIALTIVASLALSTSILAHHFTGMAAIGVIPDPTRVVTPNSINPALLALWIAGATTLVLGICAIGLIIDQRINEKSEQLSVALNNMYQGLCMLNEDFEVVVVNGRFLEMFGIAPQRVKPRMTMRALIDMAEESVPFASDSRVAIRRWAQNLVRERKSGKTIFTRVDGRIFCITHEHMPTLGGWVETFEDITERRQAEDKIAYMARHDGLTGLPNRAHFREKLESALKKRDDDEAIAVLFLDIDRFKIVNDTLGHHYGDELLQIAAARMRGALRDSDVIARIGGDEFSILQSAKNQPAAVTALAHRLVDVMNAPIVISDQQMQVGVSIGISLAPADGAGPDQLLKNADLALYRAKAEGRGMYRFFEPGMDARMQARRELEFDLRHAVAANGFELHYQPIIDVETDEISGFEALLRWNDPIRGRIPPMDFIPLAEETGLIVPIGEWVLREACGQAACWPPHIHIAVNLSSVQFKSGSLVSTVINAMAASGLAPNRLELEITESVLLLDSEATLTTLHQLRDLGVSISMDDFGTGYSSLSYLRKFPFDKIKIDQSFIRELAEGGDSLAIVRAVTGLGSSLGISTVAEGVETAEQLKRLKAEGCDAVQGFYFGAAKPAAEATAFLKKSRKLRVVA
ncbi:MAG TPA: EAL domain-containing protein [Xanthobacteraceae bacterium]|jgi:diguanylate cyclase (GGDEF)-like protein/PAS domain S-box-containing protein|nr:EAL domain-containing protein [Xanthobacteraceae bacterium]